METLLSLDHNIFFYINNPFHNSFFNIFFGVLNLFGTWWVLAPICLSLIYLHNRKKIISDSILLLICAVATGIILHFFKWYIKRPRPLKEFDLLIQQGRIVVYYIGEKLQGSNSFPSGHTQTAFTAATFLNKFLEKKYSFFVFLLAIGVGIARIYSGVHFPSDVVAGVLIGIIPTLIIIKLYRNINQTRQ